MQVPPRVGGKGQGHSAIYLYIMYAPTAAALAAAARARDYNPGTETRLASSRAFGFVPRMAAPAPSIVTRVAYGVSQLPRVAWYLGHGLALRRLAEAARRRDGAKARPRVHTKAPVPDRSRLYADMAKLFLQDLANVEAGLYPLPADHDGSLLTLINRSRRGPAQRNRQCDAAPGPAAAP